jgi:hypothetical protein
MLTEIDSICPLGVLEPEAPPLSTLSSTKGRKDGFLDDVSKGRICSSSSSNIAVAMLQYVLHTIASCLHTR